MPTIDIYTPLHYQPTIDLYTHTSSLTCLCNYSLQSIKTFETRPIKRFPTKTFKDVVQQVTKETSTSTKTSHRQKSSTHKEPVWQYKAPTSQHSSVSRNFGYIFTIHLTTFLLCQLFQATPCWHSLLLQLNGSLNIHTSPCMVTAFTLMHLQQVACFSLLFQSMHAFHSHSSSSQHVPSFTAAILASL